MKWGMNNNWRGGKGEGEGTPPERLKVIDFGTTMPQSPAPELVFDVISEVDCFKAVSQ